jgi:hypothetical protein
VIPTGRRICKSESGSHCATGVRSTEVRSQIIHGALSGYGEIDALKKKAAYATDDFTLGVEGDYIDIRDQPNAETKWLTACTIASPNHDLFHRIRITTKS